MCVFPVQGSQLSRQINYYHIREGMKVGDCLNLGRVVVRADVRKDCN